MPGASATAVKDKDKSTSTSFSIDDTLNAEVLWCLKLIVLIGHTTPAVKMVSICANYMKSHFQINLK